MRESKRLLSLLPIIFLSVLPAGCDRHGAADHGDGHGHGETAHAEHDNVGKHGDHEDDDEGHPEHEAGFIELTPDAESQIGVKMTPAVLRSLSAVLETTGQVDFDATRLTHVSPRISGRTHSVGAQLGDDVQKGQSLSILDSIELGQAKAAYMRAKAQHDLTKRNFERERGLLEDRISSEREVLAAEAMFREATADYAAAEQTLHLYGLSQQEVGSLREEDPKASFYTVRAPLSGRVVEKHITLGELVTPEHNLFTIADLSHVWIWIDVYERDLRQVHVDDEVDVVLDAYPGVTFRGKVSYLSDQVDAHTRTVRARVDVANPDGKLRPGSFAKVRVADPHSGHDGSTGAAVIVVPQQAVQRDGNESVVFVGAGERRFERREVQIGRRSSGLVEILVGLAEGESVVAEGAFLLKSESAKESMGGGHSH